MKNFHAKMAPIEEDIGEVTTVNGEKLLGSIYRQKAWIGTSGVNRDTYQCLFRSGKFFLSYMPIYPEIPIHTGPIDGTVGTQVTSFVFT